MIEGAGVSGRYLHCIWQHTAHPYDSRLEAIFGPHGVLESRLDLVQELIFGFVLASRDCECIPISVPCTLQGIDTLLTLKASCFK